MLIDGPDIDEIVERFVKLKMENVRQASAIVKLVGEIEQLPKPPRTILKRWVRNEKIWANALLADTQELDDD